MANLTAGALPDVRALLQLQENLLDGTLTRADVDNIAAVAGARARLEQIDECIPFYTEWKVGGTGVAGRLKNTLCLAAQCCRPEFEAWLECNKHNCLKDVSEDNPATPAHVARAARQNLGAALFKRGRVTRATPPLARDPTLPPSLAREDSISAGRRRRAGAAPAPPAGRRPAPAPRRRPRRRAGGGGARLGLLRAAAPDGRAPAHGPPPGSSMMRPPRAGRRPVP